MNGRKLLLGEKGDLARLRWIIREVFAVTFWVFFIIKFFIFDIDIYLVNAISPKLVFVVKYKFFVLLVFILILWNRLGNRGFLKLLGYLFAYPFIFFLWRIPQILLQSKSWVVILSYFSAVVSFFKSVKVNLVVFGALSLSTVLILTQEHQCTLISAMLVIGVYLVWHYVKRFISSFKAPQVLGINTSVVEKFSRGLQEKYIDVKLIGESSEKDMTEEGRKKYIEKLGVCPSNS